MLKILFAEDTEVWVDLFGPDLKELGLMTHVDNGNDARKEMTLNKYDIIVCDHYMPRTNGDAVYNDKMKLERSLNKETPFVSFSSMLDDTYYQNYKDDKNFHIMRKDCDAELVEFIKEILKGK